MRLRTVPVFVLVCLVSPAGPAAPSPAKPDTSWEERARKVLEERNQEGLRKLAAEFRKLAPETRRALPLRIREDSVEFVFRGEFPAEQFGAEILEYLISGPEKDYESLLVAPEAERQRMQGLRMFFAKHAEEGRRHWWSARYVWAGEDGPESVELTDLLILLGPKERDQFLDQLSVNAFGLGGTTNVKADTASLPRKRVGARLFLTLRIATAG